MDKVQKTIESYDNTVAEYADKVSGLQPAEIHQFLALLTEHAHILDVGCGSGRDAAHFIHRAALLQASISPHR
ncbi:MAG: class I SAM-dependent methyltransferase [Candidatus Woesearchaeota archaeon]|nr:class I SAM-dependent methyltransferase [Candidatus Woesearchaeota archaeon]